MVSPLLGTALRTLLTVLFLSVPAALAAFTLLDLKSERLSQQADRLEGDLELLPALSVRQQAIRLAPLNAVRRTELAGAARTLWYLRNKPEYRRLADEAYETAFQLSPSRTDSLFGHAQMYSFKGNPERAIPFLKRALNIDPNNAGLVLELARDQLAAGNREQALASYRRCLDIDRVPECRWTLATLVATPGSGQ